MNNCSLRRSFNQTKQIGEKIGNKKHTIILQAVNLSAQLHEYSSQVQDFNQEIVLRNSTGIFLK